MSHQGGRANTSAGLGGGAFLAKTIRQAFVTKTIRHERFVVVIRIFVINIFAPTNILKEKFQSSNDFEILGFWFFIGQTSGERVLGKAQYLREF